MDGWMDGRVDGRVGGWVGGWMDGWVGGNFPAPMPSIIELRTTPGFVVCVVFLGGGLFVCA